MKLRWIERKKVIPKDEIGIEYIELVKVLQYWEITTNTVTGSKVGKWIDVPLEVEE